MENVIIHNINEAYVVVQCSQGVEYELREYFTFTVPGFQFTPAYRNRLWDGKIRLFNINNKRIYRGLVPNIIQFCERQGYQWEYDSDGHDEFSLNEAKEYIESLKLPVEIRDYQIEAFVGAIRSRRQLILSPTGSGKSLILYVLVRYLLEAENTKGIIIVPTISLVEQLISDFKEYSTNNKWNVEEHIHKVYQGHVPQTDLPLTISTWQSIYKLPKKFFHGFDFVLGDECHLFQAKSLTTIMENMIDAKHRIGLTGTLSGAKTHELVLTGLFGSVNQTTTTKQLMDKKHLAEFNIKCLLLKHPETISKTYCKAKYVDEIKYLILNERRNKFIKNLALSLEGNTLVLYQYVDKHGKILYDMISKAIKDDRECFFIHGGTDVEIREATRKLVETQTNAIIIASFGTFSTGINIRNLHNIIFASPSKSRIRNLQSIGRGLRRSETKETATLFDIADDMRYKSRENHTFKHFSERLKLYTQEQFKFKIYKVQLKE